MTVASLRLSVAAGIDGRAVAMRHHAPHRPHAPAIAGAAVEREGAVTGRL